MLIAMSSKVLILLSVVLTAATAFPLLLLHHRKRSSKSTSWAATNLQHLKDFLIEETLCDGGVEGDGLTVYLGRFHWQAEGEKALIKIKPKGLHINLENDGDSNKSTDSASSTGKAKGINGLSKLLASIQLRLQLESGAEYGYYSGRLSPWTLFKLRVFFTNDIEVIAPASTRQITRARIEEKFMVRETGAMYKAALGPLIHQIREEGQSLQWVYNILDGKKEVKRFIHNDPDPVLGFVLLTDPKWKSHPDPQLVPREQYYNHPSVQQLGCLAICHDRSIGSLRDLRKRHLPLLKNILENGSKHLQAVYGIEPERLRAFVHYVPQFFHFHVHFSRINLMHSIEVERAHLLEDVIYNIASSPSDDYYEKVAISYTTKRSEELCKMLEASGLFKPPTSSSSS